MEINDLCIMPAILLEKCRDNPVLGPVIGAWTHDKMCFMLSVIINRTASKSHNIGEIHELFEIHKRVGIRSHHLIEFTSCLKQAYKEIHPNIDVMKNSIFRDILELIQKIIEHEKICTKNIINDVLLELEKDKYDKEIIKQHLDRVLNIINERFGC